MVKCPTCGWGMKKRKEYEMGGYIFGHYECNDICPTTVKIKSPLEWMKEKGKW